MLVVKTNRELSDQKDTVYAFPGDILDKKLVIADNMFIELQGQDQVSAIFETSLNECCGCAKLIDNNVFIANYLYSEQCAKAGRSTAFNIVHNRHDVMLPSFTLERLSSDNIDELEGQTVAIDIETGTKLGIRCITFATQKKVYYCKQPISAGLVKTAISRADKIVGHYLTHDLQNIEKYLKINIDYDKAKLADTILFNRGVEYRNLQYLIGVYLGGVYYKDELEQANKHNDIMRLVQYCAKDSWYCLQLYNDKRFKAGMYDDLTCTQVIASCKTKKPKSWKYEPELFSKYPQFRDMTKKELKLQLCNIEPHEVQLLQQALAKPEPQVSYHSLDGLKVSFPDGLTGKCYVLPADGTSKSIEDVMLNDDRFNSPEISTKRYNKGIIPTHHFAKYDVKPSHILYMNDVVAIVKDKVDGCFEEDISKVKELFNV